MLAHAAVVLLLVAADGGPPDRRLVLIVPLVALVFGLTVAPIAWVEVGARVRREPPSPARLWLAALLTAPLVGVAICQTMWYAGLVRTGSYEGALAFVGRELIRVAGSPELTSSFLLAALGWPFLLLVFSALRAGLVPSVGRLLFHLLFFPLAIGEVLLAAAIDALDARLFGVPEVEPVEAEVRSAGG